MSAPATTPPPRVRAHRPALIDAKILVIAAIVASPVGFRVSQGLLSVTDALIRYLLVVVACAAAGAVVRSMLPQPVRRDPAPPDGPSDSAAPLPDDAAAGEEPVT